MADQRLINTPQRGLNRNHINIGEADYSTLLNGLFDGLDSGDFIITNEMSNLLSSRFKEGFKVINATNDPYSNITYFFLVNPQTGVGEFGQIKNMQQVDNLEDIDLDCDTCYPIKELAEPLETLEQVELNTYQTLLTDACHHPNNTELSFNFSILHPIKYTVIKNEKCGKTLYFSDNYNPPRYIILDNLAQYQVTGNIVCGEDLTIPTCLDSDKLLIFKKTNPLKIKPSSIIVGGKLKLGVYEFLGAYCDKAGNVISEFTSLTNPIQIFDKNNTVQVNAELSTPTNFAIKLDISDLDNEYTHYKIIVLQTTLESGVTRIFEEGVHTINDNVVVYGGDFSKNELSLAEVIKENLYITQAEIVEEVNNHLLLGGLTLEKEINLQPVVNLLGSFLKWQTHIAPENLYEDGVNASLYGGISRDEVVPYSIRFLLEGGYKTALFPFVGRPITNEENVVVVDEFGNPVDEEGEVIENPDIESLIDTKGNCNSTDRRKFWQFYNTATEEGECNFEGLETVEVTETITKTCYIEDIALSENGTFTVELTDPFTDFEEYIEQNRENCTGDTGAFGNSDLCEKLNIENYPQTCLISLVEVSAGNFEVGVTYTILTVETTDFTLIGALSNTIGASFTATGAGEGTGVATYELPLFEDNCEPPVLVPGSEIIEIVSIDGAVFEGVEKDFPNDYSRIKSPSSCNNFIIDSANGGYDIDEEFKYLYMYLSFNIPSGIRRFNDVILRDYNFSNESCQTADDIINLENPNSSALQGYFHNYLGALTLASLQTSKNAITTTPYFTNKIHKGSLWYKGFTNDRTSFIFEISKQKTNTTPARQDKVSGENQEVRVSLFNTCSDVTPFWDEIVSLSNSGLQYKITVDGSNILINDGTTTHTITPTTAPFPNGNFYVVIDNPIYECIGLQTYTEDSNVNSDSLQNKFRTAPTDGCYSIVTRDIEFSAATISWDLITFRKKSVYTSTCTYQQPIVKECKAFPFKTGKFSAWESEQKYSDNVELFDSSTLEIKPSDLPSEHRDTFEGMFTNGLIGEKYAWKETEKIEGEIGSVAPITDFTCRNIRHFKMPDNKVAPFMSYNQQSPFSKSIIYPLGVTIDEELINSFLDIAVNNSLISQEKRNKIISYEIFRGDISQDRSVIASGLLYDVRTFEDTKEKITVAYSNYPFNDLGYDRLNLDNQNKIGSSNNNYTFHSPETDYSNITLPTELSIQGYSFGRTNGRIEEVKDHSKWVILSSKAKDLATFLAIIETSTEIAVNIAQSSESWRGYVGLTNSVNPVGIAQNIAVVSASLLNGVATFGRYRLEWLRTFRDLGRPENFAYYYYGEGNYNYLKTLQQEENSLRRLTTSKYLKHGMFINTDEVTGERLHINNKDRETSVLVSTGSFDLKHPADYVNFDNNSVDRNNCSLTYASENGVCESGKSSEIRRNIASPYVHLKNYLPSQYNTLGSIVWKSTGYRGDLKNPRTDCLPIFGGDTYITRHTLKRKMPLFETTAFDLADLTPFNYKFYNTIGRTPKFYVDYEQLTDLKRNNALFPEISYDLKFDCKKVDGNYYKTPSKFYLYYYGVPNFLTETRINTNLRTAEPPLNKNFFPNIGDIGEWTQERNVSIKEPNYFFYNNTYRKTITDVSRRTLTDTYKKDFNDCANDKPNGIHWSNVDNSENDLTDPWLIFNPLNFFEFPISGGKLRDIKTIEREQVLVRFENSTALFNQIDTVVDDGTKPETVNLARAFVRRPLTYSETELGHGGSQSHQSVSCEFGHFHVDAKRGQVIQIPPGGQGFEEISSFVQGKPTYMRNWFKEHLPFKILKSKIEGIEGLDTDNAYNGVGITMGYDSRFRRVFITKKDYVPISDCLGFDGQRFYDKCVLCDDGADIVFILDATASQQSSVNNIKNSILTTIVPAIVNKFGENYRLGLVSVTDKRQVNQTLFSILTPMQVNNDEAFTTAINTIVASGGMGIPEPTDKAIEAVLNNTSEINYLGNTIGTNTVGLFRENAAKVIFLFTDAPPSGLNDAYTTEDWANVQAVTANAISKNVQIFSYLTSGVPPIPQLPPLPDTAYVMRYYAEQTGGAYSFNSLGQGITNSVVENIENIECDKTYIDLTNTNYFKDVSFTIAYSPVMQSWMSWYSYKPNYYVSHNNYFQTGINQTSDENEFGLWSHLLTNKSYQVFYGKKNPFILEYMLKRGYGEMHLKSIGIDCEIYRYHNEYDMASINDKPINKMVIYSQNTNSGNLNLINNTGQISFISKYPITSSDNKQQDILTTLSDGVWAINYFYNRILKFATNVPAMNWDENQIISSVNTDLVKFGGKNILEPFRTNKPTIRLQQDAESRLRYIINLTSAKVNSK